MWTADFIVVKYVAFDLGQPSYLPFYQVMTVKTNVVHTFKKMLQSEPLHLCQTVISTPTSKSAIFKDGAFQIKVFSNLKNKPPREIPLVSTLKGE